MRQKTVEFSEEGVSQLPNDRKLGTLRMKETISTGQYMNVQKKA